MKYRPKPNTDVKYRSKPNTDTKARPKPAIRISNRTGAQRQHRGGETVKDKTAPPRSSEKDIVDDKRKTVSKGKEENGHGVHTTHAVSDSWVIEVKERFDHKMYKKGQPSSDVSIYWVPATIRAPKPEAYVPMVASFGPYHHHMKFGRYPHAIDDYKLEAVQRTIERIGGITIDDLIAEVGNLEKKIRNCYEDSANEYSEKALSWMFTMDACFILEFLRTQSTTSSKEEERSKEQERISLFFEYNDHKNIFRSEILRDIVKLENQIPLFVLIKILELECKNKENDAVSTLVSFLLPFQEFCGFPFSLPPSDAETKFRYGETGFRLKNNIENNAAHLLDLSRRMIKDLLQKPTPPERTGSAECGVSCITDTFQTLSCNSSDDDSTLSAEKLDKAGIIFKPTNAGVIKFEGRYFRSSTFCIPEITVDDDTEILLRNLIALEECQGSRLSPEATIISNYIHLMDDLIDTSVDVGLLKRRKVIKSLLGSDEEIAATINDLCKGITDNPYPPYDDVVEEVRKHYNSQLKVLITQFREEYCSKPWYVISLVAATLLLGMTAVQTIFTVKN